jgi:lysophospholipase L1-like esterase
MNCIIGMIFSEKFCYTIFMNTNSETVKILCYGDSNTWGWVPGEMGKKRFNVDERYPGILQKLLGDEFEVLENGLGARTTNIDDPRTELPNRNGLNSIVSDLDVYSPLDFVIIMLGTTDTKEMLNRSVEEISEGLEEIVKVIQSKQVLDGYSVPKVIIVTPSIVNEEVDFAKEFFKGGEAKGLQLRSKYAELAQKYKCDFIDPTNVVNVDERDGVHLSKENHKALAELISKKFNK